jgi:hypothetical protein
MKNQYVSCGGNTAADGIFDELNEIACLVT